MGDKKNLAMIEDRTGRSSSKKKKLLTGEEMDGRE
jgi:hypothetical protein